MTDVAGSSTEQVGTELLFENDRVRVWAMRLEPGETCTAHRHHHDYLMIYPTAAVARSSSRSTIEHIDPDFVAFSTVGRDGLEPHQIVNLGSEAVTHYVIELLGPSAAETAQPITHNGRIRVEPPPSQ